MKILMRNQKSERWKLVESAAFGAEAELQELLATSPTLIHLNQPHAPEKFKAAVEALGRTMHSEERGD